MCTQALAVNGAKVYIVGRSEDKLETVAQQHGKGISGQIIPLTADITSKQEILKLAQEIESREKCLCILINNAGIQATGKITPGGENAEEFRDNLFHSGGQEFDNWTSEYKTNVAQCYFMTGAFLPLLQRATEHQKGYSGTVINITSISGMYSSRRVTSLTTPAKPRRTT